ncbi:MAG: Rrf2 family transcriptional regulator [Saprospiraceae bacterium]|nr:Rrf2 family transcriptional regulator [Saprospiraceae bacterium]
MFTKSCKYAIRAVMYLATESSEEKKSGVDEIATALEVPKHFLAKILQRLTRNRIISSAKGRNGGFYLSRANQTSNLLAVIECMDGPSAFNDCVLGLESCSNENPCPYHNTVKKYRDAFFEVIKNETIGESASRIKSHNFRLRSSTS